MHGRDAPAAGSPFFSDVTYQTAELRLPGGTRADYAAAEGWKNFIKLTEITPAPTYAVEVKCDSPYGHIELQGLNAEGRAVGGQPLIVKCVPLDADCCVKSLLVDGEDVTAELTDGTYRLATVRHDVVVEADFGLISSSGVEILPDGAGVRVSGNDILIDIPGLDAEIYLHDMAGHLIYRGTDRVITAVPAGVYVLTAGPRSYKLSVR